MIASYKLLNYNLYTTYTYLYAFEIQNLHKVLWFVTNIFCTSDDVFFCIQCNIPFNTFWVISGRCLLVQCNRWYDKHFMMLSHSNKILHHRQGRMIARPRHIILSTGQPVFALTYPLYVEHLTRELQLNMWNLWFVPAGNRTRDIPDFFVSGLMSLSTHFRPYQDGACLYQRVW